MTTGRSVPTGIIALPCLILLTACSPSYSPDTYSSTAVQHAEKVDQGIVVGERVVAISADPTIGTATGGAAGGIAGSQVGDGPISALGAVGGTVAGGLVGNVVAHSTDDTFGYEYIVRKPSGDLLSVTQKDAHPLAIGQHVLIIEGAQARIVPDYTVQIADAPHPAEGSKPAAPLKPDEAATATASLPAPQPTTKPEQPPSTQTTSSQPAPLPDAQQPSQSATAPAAPAASPPAGGS